MADRASVFADDEVIALLSARFVPVALDEWYSVRRKDPAGDLYRQVVYLECRDGKVTRLDLVARGEFWGQGRYTGGAPVGRFTLAVAFALAGGGEASRVPPQGARDLADYLGR